MMGGAALGVAYAGSGMYDLYAHHYVQPWDIAAGILIVRESGGIATDLAGRPAIPESGCIVAGGMSIHNQFMTLTQGSAWRVTGS
jgi:myo-inositol-1(or 4)-monophosphatase